MEIKVDKKDKLFILTIGQEEILQSEKLSDVVNKIEAYLKMRYLPEPVKKTFLDRLSGFTQ